MYCLYIHLLKWILVVLWKFSDAFGLQFGFLRCYLHLHPSKAACVWTIELHDSTMHIQGECLRPQINKWRKRWMRFPGLYGHAAVVHWQDPERLNKWLLQSKIWPLVGHNLTQCHFLKWRGAFRFQSGSWSQKAFLSALKSLGSIQGLVINLHENWCRNIIISSSGRQLVIWNAFKCVTTITLVNTAANRAPLTVPVVPSSELKWSREKATFEGSAGEEARTHQPCSRL